MSGDSPFAAYSAIEVISFIAVFGIKSEKSDSIVAGSLNSAILNESVQTNTNFLFSHSDFVFINTQVKILFSNGVFYHIYSIYESLCI